jgi:hypothetical protein
LYKSRLYAAFIFGSKMLKENAMKLILTFGVVLFFCTSCGLCDTDSDNGPNYGRYAGTYNLTAWNAPVPVDIDQNGTSSRNLLTESTCYHPSKIILSPDRNYMKHEHYPVMESTATLCGSVISSGVWTVQGSTIKLVSSEGEEERYDYGEVNDILTRSESNWMYPVVNGGEGAYALGDVNMVFTKE